MLFLLVGMVLGGLAAHYLPIDIWRQGGLNSFGTVVGILILLIATWKVLSLRLKRPALLAVAVILAVLLLVWEATWRYHPHLMRFFYGISAGALVGLSLAALTRLFKGQPKLEGQANRTGRHLADDASRPFSKGSPSIGVLLARRRAPAHANTIHQAAPGSQPISSAISQLSASSPRLRLHDAETLILKITNRERRHNGIPPLAADPILSDTARGHSADMLERDFFDHKNPDGLDVVDRVSRNDPSLLGAVGENIWMSSVTNFSEDRLAEEIVIDWMNSTGHRANILNRDYTYLGVGVCAARGGIRATQVFAKR